MFITEASSLYGAPLSLAGRRSLGLVDALCAWPPLSVPGCVVVQYNLVNCLLSHTCTCAHVHLHIVKLCECTLFKLSLFHYVLHRLYVVERTKFPSQLNKAACCVSPLQILRLTNPSMVNSLGASSRRDSVLWPAIRAACVMTTTFLVVSQGVFEIE